jgi:hypothetical protein
MTRGEDVGRWERMQNAPSPAARRALKSLFGPPPWETTGSRNGQVPVSRLHGRISDVERRDFLVRLALAGVGAAGLTTDQVRRLFGAFAQESSDHAAVVGLTNVGPGMLEGFQVNVHQLAVGYVTDPSPQVFALMVDLRDQVTRLLEGRQRPVQTHTLHLLSGELSILMATATADFGDPNGAAAHALAALADAEAIGHDELRGWAMALLSRAHRYAGRPQDAVAAAQAGQRFADRGHVRSRLLELEARALTEMGDRHALRVIAQVGEHARPTGLDISDGLGGEFSVSPGWVAYSQGAVALGLGDYAGAVRETERSLQLYEGQVAEDQSVGNITLGRIHLATAHAQMGNADGAAEVLSPVLTAPHKFVHLPLYDGRLDDLVRVLAQPRLSSATARQLTEHIGNFRTARPALSV